VRDLSNVRARFIRRDCVGFPSEPKAVPTCLHGFAGRGNQSVWIVSPNTSEGWNAGSLLAAQELMHWYSQGFAFDIVKGYINRGHRCGKDASSFEVLAAIHLLPERSNQHGIPSNQKLPVMINRAYDS
jgi:hypothetical protein